MIAHPASSDLPLRDARMRIAVCDDAPEDLRRLSELVERLSFARDASVDRFQSASQLLDAGSYDIVFLDILMDGMDGMEAARRLRKRRENCLIIFVTSSREYLVAGYEVEAFRYILKPFDADAVRNVLDQALARVDVRTLTFRGDGVLHRVPLGDISYIEAQKRQSVVHLLDGSKLVAHEGITQLASRINESLLMRCQKSFIVNLNEIRGLRRYEVSLRSGAVIPVGRKLWPALRERLVTHLAVD